MRVSFCRRFNSPVKNSFLYISIQSRLFISLNSPTVYFRDVPIWYLDQYRPLILAKNAKGKRPIQTPNPVVWHFNLHLLLCKQLFHEFRQQNMSASLAIKLAWINWYQYQPIIKAAVSVWDRECKKLKPDIPKFLSLYSHAVLAFMWPTKQKTRKLNQHAKTTTTSTTSYRLNTVWQTTRQVWMDSLSHTHTHTYI